MSHHISALVIRGTFNHERAATLSLQAIELTQDVVLFPLTAGHLDTLSDRLEMHGSVSDRPVLNLRVVHHLARELVGERLFAVIETDYFGGSGDQAAAVYRGAQVAMSPKVAEVGPINEALRHLGVVCDQAHDEFEAIGLTRFRSFD